MSRCRLPGAVERGEIPGAFTHAGQPYTGHRCVLRAGVRFHGPYSRWNIGDGAVVRFRQRLGRPDRQPPAGLHTANFRQAGFYRLSDGVTTLFQPVQVVTRVMGKASVAGFQRQYHIAYGRTAQPGYK